MASMEDLIATISVTSVNQQGADLKELHSALASTLQRGPSYHPVAPVPSGGPHSSTIPPAPASSWNDQAASIVPPSHLWASPMGNSPRQTVPLQAPSKAGLNLGTAGGGSGSGSAVPFTGRRETGFSPERERPHHSVLPSDASPVESVGFANDAFRPLWDKEPKSPWAGFHAAAAPAKTT